MPTDDLPLSSAPLVWEASVILWDDSIPGQSPSHP